MKLRRPVGLAIGVVVAALALQACSAPSPSASGSSGSLDGTGKTLNVLVQADTNVPDKQKLWFNTVSAAFKKETGATVNFTTFATTPEQLTKMQTAIVSGVGPDVIGSAATGLAPQYATNAFVKFTDADWKKLGGKDNFVAAAVAAGGPSGKGTDTIAVPWNNNPFVLAYNTKMFKAAGIDKPADSWDGLTDQAKQLTTGGVYGLAVPYNDPFQPWKFVWNMTVNAGNPFVVGNKAQINDPTTLASYNQFFNWLTTDKVVNPKAIGWSGPQAQASFAAGDAAMYPMASSTAIPTLDASPIAKDYSFSLMPTIPPGHKTAPKDGIPATSIISGYFLTVPKYSKNRDLDLALIKMMTSDKFQVSNYKYSGYIPYTNSAAKKIETPQLAPIIESQTKSVAVAFTGSWGDVQSSLANVAAQMIPSLSKGTTDESTLKGLLATAQKTAQASLDKQKK